MLLARGGHRAAGAGAGGGAGSGGSGSGRQGARSVQLPPSTRLFASRAGRDAPGGGGGSSSSSADEAARRATLRTLRAVPGLGKAYLGLLDRQGIQSVEQLSSGILEQLQGGDASQAFAPAVQYLQALGIKRQDHAHRIIRHILQTYAPQLHDHLATAAGDAPAAARQAAAASSPDLTFCVEGNISAGKSTFLHYITNDNEQLAQTLGVVHEPVDQWQSVPTVGGSTLNLLDKFYSDPPKYAYTFQNYVFMSRVMQERNSRTPLQRRVRLMERSVFSDRMVFVRAVRESGWMGDVELAVYDSWFGPILESNPALRPDGFIYLKCQPTTCMERLKLRGRHEEDSISLEYLDGLHAKHEDWLGAGRPLPLAGQQQHGGAGASAGSGLWLPPGLAPPSGRLQRCLYLLDRDAPAAPKEMHSCLQGVPALVLDCDADLLRDLDAQRDVQQTVVDYIDFMRALRRAQQQQAAGAAAAAAAAGGGAAALGAGGGGAWARGTQPGAPQAAQAEVVDLVASSVRGAGGKAVPNSSGMLADGQAAGAAGTSGSLEALHAASSGAASASDARGLLPTGSV